LFKSFILSPLYGCILYILLLFVVNSYINKNKKLQKLILVNSLEKIRVWQATNINNQTKNFTVSEIVINQDVDILNELNRFNWLYK